jgi:hypothetical protein
MARKVVMFQLEANNAETRKRWLSADKRVLAGDIEDIEGYSGRPVEV